MNLKRFHLGEGGKTEINNAGIEHPALLSSRAGCQKLVQERGREGKGAKEKGK